MPSKSYHISGLKKAIGFAGTLDVLAHRFFHRRSVVRVSLRGRPGAIEIDPLGSDLFVAAKYLGIRNTFLAHA